MQTEKLYGSRKRTISIITTSVMGKMTRVQHSNVQYNEYLERSIVTYGLLEATGYGVLYSGNERVVPGIDGGPVIFNVETMKNILIVRRQDYKNCLRAVDVPMSRLTQNGFEVYQDVQKGYLMHIHRRLEHLHFDRSIGIAKDPTSSILIVDEVGI